VIAAEQPRRKLGLGVEGSADPDHVGLAGAEDLLALVEMPDPADREHRDRHRLLRGGEERPVPHRHERILLRAALVAPA
jgi:hypothetical protein